MEYGNILDYLKRSTKAKDIMEEWKYNYFFDNTESKPEESINISLLLLLLID